MDKPKQKLSLSESFHYLSRSKYLLSIAAIVVAYNLVINLVEVVWKEHVSQLYTTPDDYAIHMNTVTVWVGVLATLVALLASGNMIRRCGWTPTAMATPAILCITSVGLFGFILFTEELTPLALSMFGYTPLMMIVFFGSLQNVLSRTAKYTVFDATKEMAFIPLEEQSRLRGKTIIDGIGTRFGKSGGSVIHQGLLLSCGTVASSAPYVAAILFVAIGVWFLATLSLGRRFNRLVSEQEKRDSSKVETSPSKQLQEESLELAGQQAGL